MAEISTEKLQKEVADLGILNIEAFNEVDAVCIADTILAVKDLDRSLNIDNLLECNNKKIETVNNNAR